MSEQAKHSPAPWKAEEWMIGQGQEPRTEMVLHNNVHQIGKLTWSDAADKPWDISKGEQQANARLIAAAPELLQACREALADLEGYLAEWETDPAMETVQELRAVIAKATGQD